MSRRYHSPLRASQQQDTRELLLDTTRQLLMADGLEGLTLPRLANQAGVSIPTVYRHFSTVEELLRAFLEWLRPRIGMVHDALWQTPAGSLPQVPVHNFPLFAQHAPVLLPLMDSAAFNRVRVSGPRRHKAQARTQLRPVVAATWTDQELEALAAPLFVLTSPITWRWMRETWGLSDKAAAQAASWAMQQLLEALQRGPKPPAARPTRKKRRA